MSSCEDFKQALRTGNLTEAFLVAMSQAPELQITTWVATPESPENQEQPRSGKCLRTYINLVEGEMINEVGAELIQDRLYQPIQQFHLQQATQGHQTIEQNLQSLQKMFRLMATFQQRQQSGNLSQSSWLDANSPAFAGSPTRSLEAATNNGYQEEEDSETFNEIISLTDLELDSPSESQEVHAPSFEEEYRPSQKSKIDDTTISQGEDWGHWLEEDEDKSHKNLKTDFLDLNSNVIDEESEESDGDWDEWSATEFLNSNNPTYHDQES
jgi:hypothetical protein